MKRTGGPLRLGEVGDPAKGTEKEKQKSVIS